MSRTAIIFTVAVLTSLSVTQARADCQIADAKLEEAILQSPGLRGPANRQSVRDLRSLRDAAFTLWSYGRHADCERLLANIRELISAPSMGRLGGWCRSPLSRYPKRGTASSFRSLRRKLGRSRSCLISITSGSPTTLGAREMTRFSRARDDVCNVGAVRSSAREGGRLARSCWRTERSQHLRRRRAVP